jgi:hypothetical protein
MRKQWKITVLGAVWALALGAFGQAKPADSGKSEPQEKQEPAKQEPQAKPEKRAPQHGYAMLKFLVVKDRNGKPIRNASVILHPVDKKGRQEKGGLQLKTDGDGKTGYDAVPFGKLRIQVIAQGFQTFGEDYEIAQDEMEIAIRMKGPQEQITIYKDEKKEEPKK